MRALRLLLLLLTASGPTLADEDHDAAYRLREQQEVLPLQELISRMHLGEGARLLEIEAKLHDGRRLYEVEYVDQNGHVQELVIDARTGEIVRRDD
ncbi:MAG: PepSY domain-containing protein [Chromatiaceae bacterium]